jgi:hypothetical protein
MTDLRQNAKTSTSSKSGKNKVDDESQPIRKAMSNLDLQQSGETES